MLIAVNPGDDLVSLLRPAQSGWTYTFTPGVYPITEPLVIRVNLTFRGAGADKTILTAAPGLALRVEGPGTLTCEGVSLALTGASLPAPRSGPAPEDALYEVPAVSLVLSPNVGAALPADWIAGLDETRLAVARDTGFYPPEVVLRIEPGLRPNRYRILAGASVVATGEAFMDRTLAVSTPWADEELDGLPTKDPTSGQPAWWVQGAEQARAESGGYAMSDAPRAIADHLHQTLRDHAHEFLRLEHTLALIERLRRQAPQTVESVHYRLDTLMIHRVLKGLLKERVSIRDFGTVFELMGDAATATGDTTAVTELVRAGLSRAICASLADDEGTLHAVMLDPQSEQELEEHTFPMGAGYELMLPAPRRVEITEQLRVAIERAESDTSRPVLLCGPKVRPVVAGLLARVAPRAAVLSHAEVPAGFKVRHVDRVGL